MLASDYLSCYGFLSGVGEERIPPVVLGGLSPLFVEDREPGMVAVRNGEPVALVEVSGRTRTIYVFCPGILPV